MHVITVQSGTKSGTKFQENCRKTLRISIGLSNTADFVRTQEVGSMSTLAFHEKAGLCNIPSSRGERDELARQRRITLIG
jgi:hypothetical protein